MFFPTGDCAGGAGEGFIPLFPRANRTVIYGAFGKLKPGGPRVALGVVILLPRNLLELSLACLEIYEGH